MNSVQQYLVEEELDHYRDGLISRREFVRRATLFGAGAATAAAMAQGIVPRVAAAAPLALTSPYSVAADDPAVMSDMISYQSTDGATLVAYLAWPSDASGDRSHPAVVVCHENRGLNDHIMDVARRYAKQGYVAIAPDLPSRFGVPTSQLSPDEVMAAYRQMDAAQNAWDFKAAGDWVRSHPAVDPSKSAATGFCFGGGVIWRLTEVDDQLTAAAPFYGSSPPLEAVPQIKAAVLGVYASDDRITDSRGPLEEALDAAGVRHQTNIYPGTNHAFHNDTGAAYNQEQAVAAYKDALNWFAQYLGLPAPTV